MDKYNHNFNYEKYWEKLTEDQKDLVCMYNLNFDYEKYWEELTHWQKLILRNNSKEVETIKYFYNKINNV